MGKSIAKWRPHFLQSWFASAKKSLFYNFAFGTCQKCILLHCPQLPWQNFKEWVWLQRRLFLLTNDFTIEQNSVSQKTALKQEQAAAWRTAIGESWCFLLTVYTTQEWRVNENDHKLHCLQLVQELTEHSKENIPSNNTWIKCVIWIFGQLRPQGIPRLGLCNIKQNHMWCQFPNHVQWVEGSLLQRKASCQAECRTNSPH